MDKEIQAWIKRLSRKGPFYLFASEPHGKTGHSHFIREVYRVGN